MIWHVSSLENGVKGSSVWIAQMFLVICHGKSSRGWSYQLKRHRLRFHWRYLFCAQQVTFHGVNVTNSSILLGDSRLGCKNSAFVGSTIMQEFTTKTTLGLWKIFQPWKRKKTAERKQFTWIELSITEVVGHMNSCIAEQTIQMNLRKILNVSTHTHWHYMR